MRSVASGILVAAGAVVAATWLGCGGEAFTTAPPAGADSSADDSTTPGRQVDEASTPEPIPDARAPEGGTVVPVAVDGAPDLPKEASAPPTGCPTGHGPDMVVVAGFCIDSTEVTSAQYDDFLLAGAPLGQQPSACAFNSSYLPGNDWTFSHSEALLPIANVNWCQAFAFCMWAGKHLCGKLGGGSADFSNFTSADNEHYLACSNASTRVYPYGNAFQASACNGPELDAGTVLPVGSLSGCQGGVAGLFDMSGNVEEWQDACDGNTGASDNCLNGNGAYDFGDPPDGTRCDFADSDQRGGQFPDVGFRCCATLP
jgi:formylglycine-generating enzyme